MIYKVFVLLALISCCFNYKVGKLYQYEYDVSIFMNDDPRASKNNVGFYMSAVVEVAQLWSSSSLESVYSLKIGKFRSSNFKKSKSSTDDEFLIAPSLVLVNKNGIQSIFITDKSGSVSKRNIVRGIVGALFGNLKDGVSTETDSSGTCNVVVKHEGHRVIKTKTKCLNTIERAFKHVNPVLAERLQSDVSVEYGLDDGGIIKSVFANEGHVMSPEILSAAATSVSSSMRLNRRDIIEFQGTFDAKNLDEVLRKAKNDFGTEYSKFGLEAEFAGKKCHKCPTLKEMLSKNKKYLKTDKLSSSASAKAFLELLKTFRAADENTITKALSNKKILPQLMDILAVSQTQAAVKVAFDFIKFHVDVDDAQGVDLAERFLVSLAISSHPNVEILQNLIRVAKKELPSSKVKETLLLTIGAVLHSLDLQDTEKQVSNNGLTFLADGLEACKDDECRHIYLRAFINAKMPSSVPILHNVVKKGGKLAVTALKALNGIKRQFITSEVKETLKNVYFQTLKKQDSTARIVAADILLKNEPSQCFLEKLLKSLASQTAEEVSTYMLKRIQELSESCSQLKSKLKLALSKSSVGNYNVLAQKGLSVAMSNFLFSSDDANATYGMHTELLKGGMLKSTSFDVDLFAKEGGDRLISVGAFAAGLEGFVGDGPADDEPQEDASCGLQITVLGVMLRPYIFFNGQSELMSLVWSGAGSEPTPALQGNFLLHDTKQFIILQNGMVVEATLQGVVSTDLSGSVQISLWNRNAESSVNNKGALFISGSMQIQSAFAKADVQHNVEGDASLDFITNLDFYNSPFRMCIEMDQPPFQVKHSIQKTESMPDLKYLRKRSHSTKLDVLGKSYALPAAIYKSCASLKAA